MAKPNFNQMSEDEAKSFILSHIQKRFTKNGPLIGKLHLSERDDAISEIFIDLWKNRFNYDSTKSDFTTYAFNRGRGVVKAMKQSYLKIPKVRNKIVKDNPISYYENRNTLENSEYLNHLLTQLTEEQIKIMTLKYVEGLRIEDIAIETQISPQKLYSKIREIKHKIKCMDQDE